MASRGLSYEDLSALNPQIIFTSISPYGQTGPKSSWRATDLTVAAAGMQMNMQGDDDRPPLRIPLDQSFLHASAEAGAATLIALHERNRSGTGQHELGERRNTHSPWLGIDHRIVELDEPLRVQQASGAEPGSSHVRDRRLVRHGEDRNGTCRERRLFSGQAQKRLGRSPGEPRERPR